MILSFTVTDCRPNANYRPHHDVPNSRLSQYSLPLPRTWPIHQIVWAYKQLKQNIASIPTNLAGGQHGFLPLVLTNTQWLSIPNAEAFVRPINPGPFTPRAGRTANAKIAMDRTHWEQCLQNYQNCQHLEATLRNQLTSAFDYEILDGIRDRTTNTLQSNIPDIIKYLFEEYGE